MKRQFLNGRWAVLFLITALVLCITPAIPTQACETQPPPPVYDGPVYLILSVDDLNFDNGTGGGGGQSLTNCTTPPPQHRNAIIKVGTYVAGAEVGSTRFDLETDIGAITLPYGVTLNQLNGHEMTILGGFDTNPSEDTVHLVTPDDGTVPRKVQEAFFVAAPRLEELTVGEGEETLFPTTAEIAEFIYWVAIDSDLPAPGPVPDNPEPTMGEWLAYDHTELGTSTDPEAEPSLAPEQILGNIFETETELIAGVGPGEGDVFAEADGDLFPHQPEDGKPLFGFDFDIDKNGTLDIDMPLTVEIDVKPGNSQNVVNYKSKGVVWVAILTTVGLDADHDEVVVFDATLDVDTDTVVLGPLGAQPRASKEKDANKDGYDDLYLKFKVADIGLTKDTTEVTLRGLDENERTFAGTDLVTTVPPKGKSKK